MSATVSASLFHTYIGQATMTAFVGLRVHAVHVLIFRAACANMKTINVLTLIFCGGICEQLEVTLLSQVEYTVAEKVEVLFSGRACHPQNEYLCHARIVRQREKWQTKISGQIQIEHSCRVQLRHTLTSASPR